MTLISISPETAQIGWPRLLGYVRCGRLSILNAFGFRLVRVADRWAITVG